jgi:hypothetical protein
MLQMSRWSDILSMTRFVGPAHQRIDYGAMQSWFSPTFWETFTWYYCELWVHFLGTSWNIPNLAMAGLNLPSGVEPLHNEPLVEFPLLVGRLIEGWWRSCRNQTLLGLNQGEYPSRTCQIFILHLHTKCIKVYSFDSWQQFQGPRYK